MWEEPEMKYCCLSCYSLLWSRPLSHSFHMSVKILVTLKCFGICPNEITVYVATTNQILVLIYDQNLLLILGLKQLFKNVTKATVILGPPSQSPRLLWPKKNSFSFTEMTQRPNATELEHCWQCFLPPLLPACGWLTRRCVPLVVEQENTHFPVS